MIYESRNAYYHWNNFGVFVLLNEFFSLWGQFFFHFHPFYANFQVFFFSDFGKKNYLTSKLLEIQYFIIFPWFFLFPLNKTCALFNNSIYSLFSFFVSQHQRTRFPQPSIKSYIIDQTNWILVQPFLPVNFESNIKFCCWSDFELKRSIDNWDWFGSIGWVQINFDFFYKLLDV